MPVEPTERNLEKYRCGSVFKFWNITARLQYVFI